MGRPATFIVLPNSPHDHLFFQLNFDISGMNKWRPWQSEIRTVSILFVLSGYSERFSLLKIWRSREKMRSAVVLEGTISGEFFRLSIAAFSVSERFSGT